MKKFIIFAVCVPFFAFAQTPADACLAKKNYSDISACMVAAGLCRGSGSCTGVGQGTCSASERCYIQSSPLPGGSGPISGVCIDASVSGYCPVPAGTAGGLGGGRGVVGSGNSLSGSQGGVPPCNPSPVVGASNARNVALRATAMRLAQSAGRFANVGGGTARSAAPASVVVTPPLASCGHNPDRSIYSCPVGQGCCTPPVDSGRGVCGPPGCPRPIPTPPPPPPVCTPSCGSSESCIRCLSLSDFKQHTTCVDVSGPGPIVISKICP